MTPLLVESELASPIPDSCPEQIQFMPLGKHLIRPMVNGVQKEVELEVVPELVELFQADLTRRLNENVRPHADFDHKPGPASFLPRSFSWHPEKGIMVDVDWTGQGRTAIQDRNYSYFSPSFLMSEDKIVGLPSYGAIGALTNTPAFRGIERIAASDPGRANPTNMSKLLTQCVALGIVTVDATDDDTAAELVQAAFNSLKSRNLALEAQVKEHKAKDAETMVQAAIAEGRLAPKNEALRQFFVNLAVTDPEQAKLVLASYPVSKVLEQQIAPKAGQVGQGAKIQAVESRMAKISAGITKLQASNRELTYQEANQILRGAEPELFQDEDIDHEG